MIERLLGGRRNFLTRVALAAAAVVSLSGAFSIDRDEFACEEAAAHLAECCDGFDARSIICGGGCGYQARPDLDQTRSDCILGASCDDLVASGSCASPKRVVCQ